MGQAPHAGLRAWQIRRPCQMTRWDSIVQSRLGKRAPTACSTLTGSVSSVQPRRRASRPKIDPLSADDVAEAVLYLSRPGYVTGSTLFVDGGSHINGSTWAPVLPE